MGLLDGAFESIGKGLTKSGEDCLEAGLEVWQTGSTKVLEYCTTNPVTLGGAGGPWSVIIPIYTSFKGIGVGLLTLYFVIGYLRESIDIRNNFTIENMFRFFIRLILTATLIDTIMSIIREVLGLAAGLAAEVGASVSSLDMPEGLFGAITEGVEGGAWIGTGFICFIGGLVGMFVVIICSFQLLMAVLGRFFKIYLIIPFAPIALASYAGGQGLSHSGTSWIKTFLGYCLEIVIIALALILSFTMFSSGTGIFSAETAGLTGVIFGICEIVVPVIVAVGCVKGAETTIQRALGL